MNSFFSSLWTPPYGHISFTHTPPFPAACCVAPSKLHKRGVFATRHLHRGELIEMCPVLKIDARYLLPQTGLRDYVFDPQEAWCGPGKHTCLLALGNGSLYNHAPNGRGANCTWHYDKTREVMVLYATAAVAAGTELLHDYSDDYWKARPTQAAVPPPSGQAHPALHTTAPAAPAAAPVPGPAQQAPVMKHTGEGGITQGAGITQGPGPLAPLEHPPNAIPVRPLHRQPPLPGYAGAPFRPPVTPLAVTRSVMAQGPPGGFVGTVVMPPVGQLHTTQMVRKEGDN
ncbi:unnamed protein product [Vitrella brassicaformis CCMP3155]|uniref:SET domain-containing protein n=2 Tax=Vitrella brassicaformis TaxID=1169539 RepID=A0A0G4EHY8_VITBC|nr:unnamed protein product [Vitrella brassicaformis CCMP3155]|eukprot:CEL95592.1 unnamed protein product [Vitrella brassicaformis CCMP3155]